MKELETDNWIANASWNENCRSPPSDFFSCTNSLKTGRWLRKVCIFDLVVKWSLAAILGMPQGNALAFVTLWGCDYDYDPTHPSQPSHLPRRSDFIQRLSHWQSFLTRQEDLTAEKLRLEGDLIEEYITNSTWRGEVCHKVQVHARLSWNVSLHTTNVHHLYPWKVNLKTKELVFSAIFSILLSFDQY